MNSSMLNISIKSNSFWASPGFLGKESGTVSKQELLLIKWPCPPSPRGTCLRHSTLPRSHLQRAHHFHIFHHGKDTYSRTFLMSVQQSTIDTSPYRVSQVGVTKSTVCHRQHNAGMTRVYGHLSPCPWEVLARRSPPSNK